MGVDTLPLIPSPALLPGERFQALDRNKNGFLSYDEFRGAVTKFAGAAELQVHLGSHRTLETQCLL